jgi:hypothetical protein
MSEMLSTDLDLNRPPTDEDFLRLQFTTLLYYLHCSNPDNGLVRDKTEATAPASIAAIGMALASIPVIVERGVLVREFAAKIARKRLRFLWECSQGPEPDASGYKGFFYHFLDIYPVHVRTRKSFGSMTRKLSVTESRSSGQRLGTCSRRKVRTASANFRWLA